MDRLAKSDLDFILRSALLAPSADNRHHLRFVSAAEGFGVALTEKLPHPGGYQRVLALLSLGAVAENLVIAASHCGLEAKVQLRQEEDASNVALRIRLEKLDTQEDALWREIAQRHTNRRLFFHGPPLQAGERSEFEAIVEAGATCGLHWMDHPGIRRQGLRLMRHAEAERFRNPALHHELFSAIRFDLGWGQSCDEGLPPGALGVERPSRPLFALMRHWPIMDILNRFGVHHLLGWRAGDLPSRFAPNLGLITVMNLDDQTVLAAGRSFQRLWLLATRQGRVLQPMPASALYALHGATLESVPVGLQQYLAKGWEAIVPAMRPLMVFRMGHAKPLPICTGRKALDTYNLIADDC